MTQQTAVKWLQERYDKCPESFLTEDDFEQAKQMEKEQIKVSYGVGHNDGCAYMTNNKPDFEDQEQYYNETYVTTE